MASYTDERGNIHHSNPPILGYVSIKNAGSTRLGEWYPANVVGLPVDEEFWKPVCHTLKELDEMYNNYCFVYTSFSKGAGLPPMDFHLWVKHWYKRDWKDAWDFARQEPRIMTKEVLKKMKDSDTNVESRRYVNIYRSEDGEYVFGNISNLCDGNAEEREDWIETVEIISVKKRFRISEGQFVNYRGDLWTVIRTVGVLGEKDRCVLQKQGGAEDEYKVANNSDVTPL